MEILKNILIRLGFAAVLFFIANYFYSKYQYPKDVRKYSRVKNQIDSAFQLGEIVYMGESSNTSFNPWTDTLQNSISDFLGLYLPDKKVTAITHEGYHPGLFLEMLNLLGDNYESPKTLVITLNMRTCGPTATYSGNEASNRQEALFYTKRLPLLTRVYLSLHNYDNRNAAEMERLKFQWWRTKPLNENGFKNQFPTVKKWLDYEAATAKPEKWRQVADAYIKEFAFVLNDENDRVKDLDNIVNICKEKNVKLIFHILPESRDYPRLMFDSTLLQYMDYNVDFLFKRYSNMGVTVVNNYKKSSSIQYTDQWYPTEHLNGELRKMIAKSIAQVIAPNQIKEFSVPRNNWPNPDIKQPMADTLLKNVRQGKYN